MPSSLSPSPPTPSTLNGASHEVSDRQRLLYLVVVWHIRNCSHFILPGGSNAIFFKPLATHPKYFEWRISRSFRSATPSILSRRLAHSQLFTFYFAWRQQCHLL